MHFGHSPRPSDLALAGFGRSERQGLKQVLAVDVLTGKSKHLSQDNALRIPPKIEDTRLAEYVLLDALLVAASVQHDSWPCCSFVGTDLSHEQHAATWL